MAQSFNFNETSLAIITGASKGIGRRIAIDLSTKLNNTSKIILIARSESGLNETKSLMSKNVEVYIYPLDLSECNMGDIEKIINQHSFKVQNAVIFHNAGSLGTLDKVVNYTDKETWRKFYDLNLFSVSLLNSSFLLKAQNSAEKIFVVNISSLCGSKPFKNMGMYGSGKASRNLFFQVLAEEEANVTVLNYSPGPVDTDMVSDVISNVKDAEVKSMFTELKKQNTILKAEVTVNKLLDILGEGNYKSGALIDYYDRI